MCRRAAFNFWAARWFKLCQAEPEWIATENVTLGLFHSIGVEWWACIEKPPPNLASHAAQIGSLIPQVAYCVVWGTCCMEKESVKIPTGLMELVVCFSGLWPAVSVVLGVVNMGLFLSCSQLASVASLALFWDAGRNPFPKYRMEKQAKAKPDLDGEDGTCNTKYCQKNSGERSWSGSKRWVTWGSAIPESQMGWFYWPFGYLIVIFLNIPLYVRHLGCIRDIVLDR